MDAVGIEITDIGEGGGGSLIARELIWVRVVCDGGIVCGVDSPSLLEYGSETVASERKRTCFKPRGPIVSGVVVGCDLTMFKDRLCRFFIVLC